MRPRACIWVVNCWVYITKVDLAHEPIDVELTGEGCETGLTVDAWEDVQCKLLRSLNDDLLSVGVPTDHRLVFWSFEESIELGEKGCLRLALHLWWFRRLRRLGRVLVTVVHVEGAGAT